MVLLGRDGHYCVLDSRSVWARLPSPTAFLLRGGYNSSAQSTVFAHQLPQAANNYGFSGTSTTSLPNVRRDTPR